MTILRLSDPTLSYGSNDVILGGKAVLARTSKVGVIGPNGSGKTSLLRMILGEIEGDFPGVDWVRKPRIGYVPQSLGYNAETPLDLVGHEKAAYLGRCGVRRDLWSRPFNTLSGGEKTRTGLAIALAGAPQMLFLDEPTNHLDISGIEWLEGQIKDFAGPVIAVSHDRYFLDSVCTEIWEVRDRRFRAFPGGYSTYLETTRSERAHQKREHAKWTRGVEALRQDIKRRETWYDRAHKDAGKNDYLRRRAKKHAKQFLAKKTALQRLVDDKPEMVWDDRPVLANITSKKTRTVTILRSEDISFSYPSPKEKATPILQGATFRVNPGQKIGVIGNNGSGKTTLLRILVGELSPDSGDLWVNPSVKVGYLAQMLLDFDQEESAARNVSSRTGLKIAESRDLLGRFGLVGDVQMRPMGTLSMGERTRVALACLCHSPFDVLFLDEPTNHLDVTASQAVQEALSSFPGAILLATHDRYLLQHVADTIWHLGNGRLSVYPGGYDQYKEASGGPSPQEEGDRQAQELAARTELAYLVSQIATARDARTKAELEAKYEIALLRLGEVARPEGLWSDR